MGFRAPILAALLIVVGLSSAAADTSTIAWSEDLGDSSRRAVEQTKPLLIDVWAVWCAPCKEMEETTYADERVVTLARDRFVVLKVDADLKDSFIERYSIAAYPTLLFVDGEGQELARREGLVRTEELLPLAERIADGYAAYVDAMNGPGSGSAARFVREYLVSLSSVEIAVERCRSMARSVRRKAPGEEAAIRLELGWALLTADSPREAVKVFSALVESSGPPAVRGSALTGLVRAEQARGRDEQAAAALESLRQEYPERAAQLDDPDQRLRE
jgi:thioredoxin-like negative regulator of GroEL